MWRGGWRGRKAGAVVDPSRGDFSTPIDELRKIRVYPLRVEAVPPQFEQWIAQQTYGIKPIALNFSDVYRYTGYEESFYYSTWRNVDGEEWIDDPWAMHTFPSVIVVTAGWPTKSLECSEYIYDRAELIKGGFEIRVSTDLRTEFGIYLEDSRYIPLRPILPGFLINTLFYAAIWFALIFGGRAHMRLIRRWQGHCPLCNYDLRGDLERGCPECGWGRGEATNYERRVTSDGYNDHSTVAPTRRGCIAVRSTREAIQRGDAEGAEGETKGGHGMGSAGVLARLCNHTPDECRGSESIHP